MARSNSCGKSSSPHVRPDDLRFQVPLAHLLLQACQHRSGGVYAGKVGARLDQQEGDPSRATHQLKDFPSHTGRTRRRPDRNRSGSLPNSVLAATSHSLPSVSPLGPKFWSSPALLLRKLAATSSSKPWL